MVAYDVRADWDGDGGLTRLNDWTRWEPGGEVKPTAAPSTVRAFTGDDSLLVTWGTGGVFPQVGYWYDGLTPGVSYTLRTRVWVPTGSLAVLWAVASGPVGANSGAVKDSWHEISLTFTATAALHSLQIWPASSPAGGEQFWLDAPTIQTAGENITSRVLDRGTTLSIRYGRDRERVLSPVAPGRAQFELNNISRDYSPENTSSPIAGNVQPGRDLRIQATHAGSTYGLLQGHLDGFEVLPDLEQRSVQITCLDPLAKLRQVSISTPVFRALRTGEAVGLILDAAGWPAGKRDLDLGATGIPWLWFENVDAFTALQQVVAAEGPPALLTVGDDGDIVFRDRHHRLFRPASTTVQTTFRGSGAEPVMSPPVVYDHGLRDIVNAVELTVPVRTPGNQNTTVWSDEGTITLAPGQTRRLRVRGSTPFINATPPAPDVDYQQLVGTVTVTLSRNSGESTDIIMTAGVGLAQISNLQLRAQELRTVDTIVTAEDAVSIARYGRRSGEGSQTLTWASLPDAETIAQLILGQYAERLPTITITLRGGNDTVLTHQLARDLSDRVHIVESGTGLDSDCYIETIEHTITDLQHVTRFGCEKVPQQVSNVFRFDVSGQGFDDGKFGRTAFVDPDLIFRFDVAGQGFDEGVFAY